MKIGVVIPVINNKFLPGLLDCIRKNSVQPNTIIIVDNSEESIMLDTTRLNTSVYRIFPPLGVNASWNYGIQRLIGSGVDLISILNDDLLIEERFFEKLQRLALVNGRAGVFCPETIKTPEFDLLPASEAFCAPMNRREGWAWTIRTSVAKEVPPIPDKLKTFCGDDWYWLHCHKINRPWMKMINNQCYHYVSQSVNITPYKHDLKKEKELFTASC